MLQHGFLFWLETLEVASLEVVDEVSTVEHPALASASRHGQLACSRFSLASGVFPISAVVKLRLTMFDL